MSGTKAGGQKAKETMYKKYGKDWFKKIGAIGGHNGHTGGFAQDPKLAKLAGIKGGKKSKRGPAKRDENGNVIRKDGTLAKYANQIKDYERIYG